MMDSPFFLNSHKKNAFWAHSLKSFVNFYWLSKEWNNKWKSLGPKYFLWNTKYCSQLPFFPPIYTSQGFFSNWLPHIQYRKENNFLRFIISFVFRFLPVFCFLEIIHRIQPLVDSSVYFQLKREAVKKLSQLRNWLTNYGHSCDCGLRLGLEQWTCLDQYELCPKKTSFEKHSQKVSSENSIACNEVAPRNLVPPHHTMSG